MRPLSQTEMTEATRLTREGRLEEAMALLQGVRRPGPVPPAPAPGGPADGPRTLIDMVPPSAASAGAWTAPPPGSAAAPDGAARLRTSFRPASLEGLMDRLGGSGVGEGLGSTLASGLGDSLLGRLGAPLGSPSARAPAALPPGARFEEGSFANPAGSRPYKLYVPSTFSGEAMPLVVMLHGCTQSPDDFAAGTRMNELAEETGLLVLYPAQTQAANMSRCWNWFNAVDQQREGGEPSLIAGMTRAVMRDLPVAEGRVYVAGLSAGGAAAAVMGATHPDLYAAVGVHSGLACGAARDMAGAFAAMRQGGGAGARARRAPIPTIVFHGDRDPTVHAVNGDEVMAQAGAGPALRAEVEGGRSPGGMAFTRTVHRDGADRVVLEQWVLHGAGHAWSGGSAAGSYTDPLGPDASREMLRFFLSHRAAPAA